jgi:hypothetical protein
MLARLTDRQWDDAFRAAGYSPDIRARYIRKIKSNIREGLDLRTRGERGDARATPSELEGSLSHD